MEDSGIAQVRNDGIGTEGVQAGGLGDSPDPAASSLPPYRLLS
jgi:hypothetical protein